MTLRMAGLLLFLAGWTVAPLAAQSDALAPDARIRVRSEQGDWLTGRLVSLDTDSVVLSTDDGEVSMPRSEISRLDLSAGRKRATVAGLGYGTLFGALFGFAVGLPEAIDGGTGGIFDPGAEALPYTTLGGAALGALLGTVIGTLSHSDRWVPVEGGPVPLTIFAEPLAEGARLGLVARF